MEAELTVNGIVATTSRSTVNFNEQIINDHSTKSMIIQQNNHSKKSKTPIKPSIAGCLANMPRFYWPGGKAPNRVENDVIRDRLYKYFETINGNYLQLKHFDEVCRRMNFAVYSKRAVFDACCRLNEIPTTTTGVYSENADDLTINFMQFLTYWNKYIF